MPIQIGKYIIRDWVRIHYCFKREICDIHRKYCGTLAYAKYDDKELYFVQITYFKNEYKLLTNNNIEWGFSSEEFKSEEEAKNHIDNFSNNLLRFKMFV